jgi:tetratricopeptide (TPR) repeat protein
MLPYFVLGALAGAVTIWMESERVGAHGPQWALSTIDRILISGRALAFYVGKLLWPVNLTFSYPRWQIDPTQWWQWLYPVAAITTLLALWLARNRIGRGPLVAALCFAGTLIPALGFINVYPMLYSFVADHFQYVACAALFALAAAVLTTFKPFHTDPSFRYSAIIVLLTTLGIVTWRQAGIYRNEWTLWDDTLAKNPGSWLAHNNLGLLCVKEELRDAARRHFEHVLPFDPVNAHNNLGSLCMSEGDWDGARSHYQQTLLLQPDHFKAQYNMGLLEEKCGFPAKSIGYFESALGIEPDDAKVHTDLGLALLKLDRIADARRHLERAIAIEPWSWRAHNGLALALDRLGQSKEAAFHYARVIALEPHYAPAQEALRRITESPR